MDYHRYRLRPTIVVCLYIAFGDDGRAVAKFAYRVGQPGWIEVVVVVVVGSRLALRLSGLAILKSKTFCFIVPYGVLRYSDLLVTICYNIIITILNIRQV